MKLEGLVQKYVFHDSGLELIMWDLESKNLVMKIKFCRWMQDDFREGMNEQERIQLLFHGVSHAEYSGFTSHNQYDEILECDLVRDPEFGVGLNFLIYNQEGIPYQVRIFAESVEFKQGC